MLKFVNAYVDRFLRPSGIFTIWVIGFDSQGIENGFIVVNDQVFWVRKIDAIWYQQIIIIDEKEFDFILKAIRRE